jgi:hypothetical protein
MRVSAPASIITWCCAVFCYVAVRSVDGLSTKISAGGFECFSEVVSAGASLSFTFQVIGGGDRDVDVVLSTTTVQPKASDVDTEHILTSQNHVTYAHILQSWTKSTDGEYILTAPLAGHGLPTKVKACFNNQFSRLTPKWVSFSLVAQDVGAADQRVDVLRDRRKRRNAHRYGGVSILVSSKVFVGRAAHLTKL